MAARRAGDSWCSGVAVARRHVPRAVVVAIDHGAAVASLAFCRRRPLTISTAHAAPSRDATACKQAVVSGV